MSATVTPSRSATLNALKGRDLVIARPAFEGVIKWLDEFEQTLATTTPEQAFGHFRCLMIDVQGTCECKLEDMRGNPALRWLHFHHPEHNRIIRELLWAYDMLDTFRALCQADVDGPETDPGFGQYIRKDYGRQLLEHFLSAEPDPAWIGS